MATLQYTTANASNDGSQSILNYTPLIYSNLPYNLAFIGSATHRFQSLYLNLSLASGSPNSVYFVTSLSIPPPGSNIGIIRRLIYNLRFTNGINQDAVPIPPSLGINAPSFVVANVSNGQVYYGGFTPRDFYAYDYDIAETKPAFIAPLGAIKSGCVPFYAAPNDNVQLVCISGSNASVYGALNIQLANFDVPTWKDFITNGWSEYD